MGDLVNMLAILAAIARRVLVGARQAEMKSSDRTQTAERALAFSFTAEPKLPHTGHLCEDTRAAGAAGTSDRSCVPQSPRAEHRDATETASTEVGTRKRSWSQRTTHSIRTAVLLQSR